MECGVATAAQCSNEARWQVRPRGGVFSNEGCVVGQIYVDANGNFLKDKEELGIPGVRLYFQDGTYLISDVEGKYSYCGLRPVTHVLKVDARTLPRQPLGHQQQPQCRRCQQPVHRSEKRRAASGRFHRRVGKQRGTRTSESPSRRRRNSVGGQRGRAARLQVREQARAAGQSTAAGNRFLCATDRAHPAWRAGSGRGVTHSGRRLREGAARSLDQLQHVTVVVADLECVRHVGCSKRAV